MDATAAGEELLITPALREVWRPFRVGSVLAVAAAVWAVVALVRGAQAEAAAATVLALAAIVQAAVRAALWRVGRGRVSLSCDEEAVHVRRGSRRLWSCPWSEVARLFVSAGPRLPEWRRWATFSEVCCVIGEWPDSHVLRSSQVLLVRPQQVEEAQQALDEAFRRYSTRGTVRPPRTG